MNKAVKRAQHKAAEAERLRRRNEAWDLRCSGWTQERIAAQLGVSQATIHRDLKWAAERALGDLTEKVKQTKLEQVGQLERIVDESLQSWQASKNPEKMVSQRKRQAQSQVQGQAVDMPVEINTRVTEQVGDRAFLSEARAAMSDIRKILGADAPLKVAPTDPTGEEPAVDVIILPGEYRGHLDDAD